MAFLTRRIGDVVEVSLADCSLAHEEALRAADVVAGIRLVDGATRDRWQAEAMRLRLQLARDLRDTVEQWKADGSPGDEPQAPESATGLWGEWTRMVLSECLMSLTNWHDSVDAETDSRELCEEVYAFEALLAIQLANKATEVQSPTGRQAKS